MRRRRRRRKRKRRMVLTFIEKKLGENKKLLTLKGRLTTFVFMAVRLSLCLYSSVCVYMC